MNDAELARNYILDRLPEEERDACERRFLFDPDFETVMLEQERALLDDYVNSRLGQEDARTVLHRVAQEPGRLYRLRFAESLKHAAAASASQAGREPSRGRPWRSIVSRRPWAWFGGMACAAALAAALIVAVAIRSRSAQPAVNPADAAHASAPAPSAPQPAAPQVTQQQSAASHASASIATFALLASQQRGEAGIPTLSVMPGVDTIRLQLTTQDGLESGRYTAAVSGAQGAAVLSALNLVPKTESGRRYVDLRIPAAKLPAGEYAIDLTRESSSAPALSFRFQLEVSGSTSSQPR